MTPWQEIPGLGLLPGFLLIFVRLSAFLWAAPLTGDGRLPPKVRVATAALVAAAFSSLHEVHGSPELALQIPLEVGVGFIAGFTARLMLAGLEVGGEVIGMQMGLGFAGTFDPSLGDMALPMRRIVFVIASFAFISVGGIQNVARLAMLPPTDVAILFTSFGALMRASGEMFLVGIHLALPILVAVTVANIAMGLANRAAPALNVYSVMLSLTGLMGAGVLLVTAPLMASEILTRAYLAMTSLPGFY
ncbi:MAG: flagellar biosynthetic protein FliR [Nannocystaceae bacterium]|nr:flagellar biosynthetic protein FliR [Nannocystaceae bacterium]